MFLNGRSIWRKQKNAIEERKTIVEYCLSHDRGYKGTASLYDVSYSQVYSWVKITLSWEKRA